MNRVLKMLAIGMLALTVAGAGLVLYALNSMTPHVESVSITSTPAWQAQENFDALMAQLDAGMFNGKQFALADDLSAQDCTFITYALRLKNAGFFPAEWIGLQVLPAQSADGSSADILQLGDTGAYVLGADSRGDLQATILHRGDAAQTQRTLLVTCYVFGSRVQFEVQAQ